MGVPRSRCSGSGDGQEYLQQAVPLWAAEVQEHGQGDSEQRWLCPPRSHGSGLGQVHSVGAEREEGRHRQEAFSYMGMLGMSIPDK